MGPPFLALVVLLMLQDFQAHRPSSKSNPVSKVPGLDNHCQVHTGLFLLPSSSWSRLQSGRDAEGKDGPGPTLTGHSWGRSFLTTFLSQLSPWCWKFELGTLHASDGSCKARDSCRFQHSPGTNRTEEEPDPQLLPAGIVPLPAPRELLAQPGLLCAGLCQ